MTDSSGSTNRRDALRTLGLASLSLVALGAARGALAGEAAGISFNSIRGGASKLRELGERLAATPRRRGFDEVPFMLTHPKYWDRDAINEVLAYRYRSRQLWENTELDGPWPGLMREAMNGQVFTLDNEDFLAVSATHGYAHLALFTQAMWDKYNLASVAGSKFTSNTLIVEKAGVTPGDKLEDVEGFYGPNNNNIISLQRRGAVFLGCHDSIHAIARQLHAGLPDSGSADKIAADLTNNMIPGVVLVPSVVAWLVELQRAGFTYSKGG
jgi:hypothetical protein